MLDAATATHSKRAVQSENRSQQQSPSRLHRSSYCNPQHRTSIHEKQFRANIHRRSHVVKHLWCIAPINCFHLLAFINTWKATLFDFIFFPPCYSLKLSFPPKKRKEASTDFSTLQTWCSANISCSYICELFFHIWTDPCTIAKAMRFKQF